MNLWLCKQTELLIFLKLTFSTVLKKTSHLTEVGLDEVSTVGMDVVPDIVRAVADHPDLVVRNVRGVPDAQQKRHQESRVQLTFFQLCLASTSACSFPRRILTFTDTP